jgi:serine protease
MPKFWTTLSVFFPNNEKLEDLIDSLQSAFSILDYLHVNPAIRLNTAPNDPLYNSQSGLFNPISGINVESAWDNGYFGADYVEVVIFDTGINWRHEDFGGPNWDESKAGFGIDYVNGSVSPEDVENPDEAGHGTAIAGIIGALRNNEKGIAGIAGGEGDDNDDHNRTGCNVYNYRISNTI